MAKEISAKNLPTKLPVGITVLIWLMLDKMNASDLTYGIAYTLVVMAWIGAIYKMYNRETVDLFKDDKSK